MVFDVNVHLALLVGIDVLRLAQEKLLLPSASVDKLPAALGPSLLGRYYVAGEIAKTVLQWTYLPLARTVSHELANSVGMGSIDGNDLVTVIMNLSSMTRGWQQERTICYSTDLTSRHGDSYHTSWSDDQPWT